MIKFLIQTIVIAFLAFSLELFFPWWSIAIAAGFGGTFLRSKANFLAGFLGIGLLWLGSAWLIDHSSSSDLPAKVAAIFQVSKPVLLAITCMIGALVGGFAALTGSYLLLRKRKKSLYQ